MLSQLDRKSLKALKNNLFCLTLGLSFFAMRFESNTILWILAGLMGLALFALRQFYPSTRSGGWVDYRISEILKQQPLNNKWVLRPILGLKLVLSLPVDRPCLKDRDKIDTLHFEILPMTYTQAPQHRSAEGALTGNCVIHSSVGQLPFEKLGDHLEILRSDDPTFLNWNTSAQGLVFIYELPLVGQTDDVLHQMFATVPRELAKDLRRLIEFDWRHMVKSPDRLAQNPEVRRLLIPYIWRHGGAEELTQFYEACLQHQPKVHRPVSAIRRYDEPVAPPPILDETNQLLIAILLDHRLTAPQQRLMILSEDPLIKEYRTRYYQRRHHETHLILGGCVGNDQAVKQALAEFLLAQDPLAIPHLIACVHQPYMRKLILTELAQSSDPRVLGLFLDLLRQGSPAEIRQASRYVGNHGDRNHLVDLHRALEHAGLSNKTDLEQAVQKIKARFPQAENQGMLSVADPHTTAGQLSQASSDLGSVSPATPPKAT